MGAPTTPKKDRATRRRPAVAAATADVNADGIELTDEEYERLVAETEAEFVRAGPIGEDGEIRPVEIGKRGKAGPELVHIFTLAGKKYHVRKHPAPAVLFKFMRDARDPRIGRDAAVENAMLDILGRTALDALSRSEDADDEDVAAVMTACMHILFGAIRKWRAAADPTSSAPPN